MERERDQWGTFREALEKLGTVTPRGYDMLPQARASSKRLASFYTVKKVKDNMKILVQ